MWELDCEEGWAPKNWRFWTVVLEKTLESPLDCKEIQPVHSEGDQPWDFFGRNDAKAETPILWAPHMKSWLIGKDSDAGRDWGQEEKGMREDEMAGWHPWLDVCEFEWTSGDGDGQGIWRAAIHGVTKSQTWLSDWSIHHLQLKTKGLWGMDLRLQKWARQFTQRWKKQMFGKQMCARLCKDNEIQRGILTHFVKFLPVFRPSLYLKAQLSIMIVPFLEQVLYLHSFRQLVQFSHSVVSDSLWPHGLQHAKLPCPSPTPRVYSNSCLLSQW